MNRFVWALCALVAAGNAGCGGSLGSAAEAAEAKAVAEQQGKASIAVNIAPVVVLPSARIVNFVGTLFGNQEVTISSQVEGQIESIAVDLGDVVEPGAALAQIDDAQWRARQREMEASLAKAKMDEERARQLVHSNVISRQEYESMQTHVEIAAAQRELMLVNIRNARVAAPIGGAVSKRFISAGEYVRPGTQLFTIVDDDPLKLRGDVPERFANELQIGQAVQIRVDAFGDQLFDGKVARISPTANAANRSVAVEAIVDNQKRQLKPGFFANAGVVTRSDDRALMVPQESLITFAGVTKLFVVNNGVAQERQVQTGSRGGKGLVEIIEGVKEGESVVVSGLSKLENGVAVTLRDTQETTAD
jgi:membrane fusion protein, multidrug efflux system